MKRFCIKKLMTFVVLSLSPFLLLSQAEQPSKQVVEFSGKIVKEAYSNGFGTYLNHAVNNDRSFYLRSTADGVFQSFYGDNQDNPLVFAKIGVRFRYTAGTDALIKNGASTINLAGTPLSVSGTSIGKTTLYLRELFFKVSLDGNSEESLHYLKFGSFPYELGRGIALGSAYNSGGFLGLNPRFAIDQYAPGGLLHTDIIKDSLSGDIYYAVLSNPNLSLAQNSEKIRTNEVREIDARPERGINRQVWVGSAALHWKAIRQDNVKLDIDPYAYMYVSPDQKLEFVADSDSKLYAIGTALEFKSGRFECGFDTAFQGGMSNIKEWDRNSTKVINNDGVLNSQYTKVYTDAELTTLAIATTQNEEYLADNKVNSTQNGQQIGDTGLYNAIDRVRPKQRFFYHGYFFVFDASYDIISKQVKACSDAGIVSGHLDDFNDVNLLTTDQKMNQNYNGFVPLQSVYSGNRLKHLVMLNLAVPRFTVQDPQLGLDNLHVQSRVTGVTTITDTFTNLAYTGFGIEVTPAKFKDQKALIKPTLYSYWMMETPKMPDGTQASSALGTTLSVEFKAILKECLECGGFVGWMIPGQHYKDMAGTQLEGGKLGSDTAYLLNFTMTYKF